MLKKKIKAFTLVEMLIVVIIIGILAAALLPKLKGAQQRARDTARKANLSQISTALEMYFNDKGRYPNGECLNEVEKEIVPTYIWNLPRDPQKGRVVYGTKDWGCEPGEYWYATLKRSWGENGACVIVANIEAPGTVWNYILPQDKHVVFSGSFTYNKRWNDEDVTENTTSISDYKLWSNVGFSEANIAEKATCSSVYMSWSSSDQSVWCWAPAGKTEGYTPFNDTMVYVVFN